MTSFGEITISDRNAWQYRALEVLTHLQEAGHKADRYPLDWTVTANGALRGTVPRLDPKLTPEDRRAIFDEWVRVVDGQEPRETLQFTGEIRLMSVFRVPTNRNDVKGSLVVDFDGPADDA